MEQGEGTSLDTGNKVSGWHRPLVSSQMQEVGEEEQAKDEERTKSLEKLWIQRLRFQRSFLQFVIKDYGSVLTLQS